MNTICKECETVAHCTKHGCIPKVRDTIDMALDAGLLPCFGIDHNDLKAFEALVRADEREACLNCYSPDDTATDWADKIRARGETK